MTAVSTIVIAPFHRWKSTNRRRPQAIPSLTCSGIVAAHDAVDPRPFVMGTNQRPITLCRGCATVMAGLVSLMPDRRR